MTFRGNPYYHEWIDKGTFCMAIIDGYMRGNAFLREEARNIVQKMKGSEFCMTILDVISLGAHIGQGHSGVYKHTEGFLQTSHRQHGGQRDSLTSDPDV